MSLLCPAEVIEPVRIRPQRAGASKQVAEYPGLGGGWVVAAPHSLADDQFHYGKNVDLDMAGRARKRGGWQRLVAASLGANGIKGLYDYRDNAGNSELFLAHHKSGTGMQLRRYYQMSTGWGLKHVRVALRGPVGLVAELAGGAGGAQFTASEHYLYVVAAESANATYANSQPAEVAHIQQANPVQHITITWKALRYAESYQVYRYHITRGWEKFDALVTGTSLTDTGALAVTAATPTTLPVDRFSDLPGLGATAPDVAFTTFFNSMIFADGRSLYRRGEGGVDMLPVQWQDFESDIPIANLFAAVTGGVAAYSTAIAYTGTKSVRITTTALNDGVELKWPLRGAMANEEVGAVTGRIIALDATKAKPVTVELAVLDGGGAVLRTFTVALTPSLVWQSFSAGPAAGALPFNSGQSLRVRILQSSADAAEIYLDDFHVKIDCAEVIRPYVPTDAEVLDPGANLLLTASNPIWQSTIPVSHSNHLWLFGNPANPINGYFSDLFELGYFPAPYLREAETAGDDRVTAAINHRERLVVFTRDTVQRVTGTGPADYVEAMVNDKVGCAAPFSPTGVENALVWLARDGVYRARTLEGDNNYLDVDRISDSISGVTFTNKSVAYGALHDGQYKLSLPNGGTVPVSAGITSPLARMMLRWYKPGRLGERSVWTAPDEPAVPLGHLVVRSSNGRLHAGHATEGIVYYYEPETYNDDGEAIEWEIWKQVDFGSTRPKNLYAVKTLNEMQYGTERSFSLRISSQSRSQTKTYTVRAMTLTDLGRGITQVEVENEYELEGAFFMLLLSNSTLNAGADIQAVALVYRPLRG